MMERKRSNSCSNMEVELDGISNLPNEVIGRILSSLPMKEGARTSGLSSKWRYNWAMVPHLVFDYFCPASVVGRVLLSHIGPITKFQISRGDVEDLDRWILPISRHPIKELIFSCHAKEPYKLPLCVFSCQELIHLELGGCLLKPSPTFNGFSNLKRLRFEFVTVAQDVLEHMIVCCHLLERLTLIFCKGFRQLKIDAPNLQDFDLLCIESLDDLSFVNTSNLAVVGIPYLRQLVSYGSSGLLKFFSDLPKVQSLNISGWLLNYMAGGALVEELPKPCWQLKSLEIFGEMEHVPIVIWLMRSSPALETLKIHVQVVQPHVGAVNSWLDKYQSCSFTQLRRVKIGGIAGFETELDFIRFLLVSSPLLQKMTVEFNPETPNHQECQDQAGAEAVNSWLDKNRSYSFTQLRHVKILKLQGRSGEAELALIRFLLMNSPVLETMAVEFRPWRPNNNDGSPNLGFLQFSLDVVKKLLRFRRASPDVEIIYVDTLVNYEGP